MPVRDWFRPPRSLLTLYVIGAATGLVCLMWLAGRLLAQEQLVEAERVRGRLEAAADRAVAQAQRSLHDLGRWLDAEDAQLPVDIVLVSADRSSIHGYPSGRLVFVPVVPPSSELPSDAFSAGERAEFGAAGLTAAADLYRAQARQSSHAIRAGALMRLGRTLRKAGRHPEALQVYSDLALLDGVTIEGRPADLFAREARCSTLEETRQHASLAREAGDLRRDLALGRWALTPQLWEYLFTEASTWAGPAAPAIDGLSDAVALAGATEVFWRQWREAPPAAAQLMILQENGPVLIVWKAAPPGMRAVVVGATGLAAIWRQISADADVQIAIADRDGHALAGHVSGPQARRLAADTGLPWNIAIGSAHPDRAVAEAGVNRRLLVAGLAIVSVLIVGSSYFTFRGIRRELAMARLQSDFVSAVSHEFRTPLTSIRQLSHLLHGGRVIDDGRRPQYYEVLVRESERLHRLVERLLSFDRAEAERYRFDSIDACDLARAVAEEFQPHAEGWRLELSTPAARYRLKADREMLSLALWNLLDNAMKYSPGRKTIWIEVSSNGAGVALAVRDEGLGIAARDRRRIFQRFVRGGGDQTSDVQGSGLGLAFVQRVVQAHGGEVRLESEVGRGSTFTIVIPMETPA